MRILHITPHYYPAMGGSDIHIKEISERLARRGHDVTVLTMNSWGVSEPDGRLKDAEIINDVKVNRFRPAGTLHDLLNSVLSIRGGHRLLGLTMSLERIQMLAVSPYSLRAFNFTLRAKPDVVAVINWYYGSLADQTSLACRIQGCALVGIPLFHTERDWSHSALYARLLGRCDAVLANTEHEKSFIERRSTQQNAHVVGVGVDASAFAHADGNQIRARYGIGNAPLVGYIGRMSTNKGVVTLIDAIREVWQTDPNVRLLLAGAGLPTSSNCQAEIARTFAGLSDAERSRIISIGRFSDAEKPSIVAALDLFAMPSMAESFGIAYLEAWACQKPVIGSRIGSTECVIDDGVDGALVTPEDPHDLARSIVRLLSDRDTRERMGRAGHAKTVARFTWDKVADKVEQIYQSAHADKVTVGPRPVGARA
jgi:glycosyltransferase involved in cell wall biosynthesis